MDMLDGGRHGQWHGRSRSAGARMRAAFVLSFLVCGSFVLGLGDHGVTAQGEKPDLVVTGFRVEDGDGGHRLVATTKNEGNAQTQYGFFVRFEVLGIVNQTMHLSDLIPPGQVRNATYDLTDWIPGTHTWRVTVDTENYVDEANEGNNQGSGEILVSTGPDLHVESASLVTYESGHGVRVVINNTGKPAMKYFTVRVQVPGFVDHDRSRYRMPANESWVIERFVPSWHPGTHDIHVTVDTEGAVRETDETNNGPTFSRHVTTGPDVRVSDLSVQDPHVVLGEPVTVRWMVENIGTHQIPHVPIRLGFVGAPAEDVKTYFVGDQREERTGRVLAPIESGNHTLRLEINPNGDRGVLTRGPSVFELPVRVHEPSALTARETYIRHWREANDTNEIVHVQTTVVGDHPAANVSFRLYEGDTLLANRTLHADAVWSGSHYVQMNTFTWGRNDQTDEYETTAWTTFELPAEEGHERVYRAVVVLDNGTAWQSTAEGDSTQNEPPAMGVVTSPPRDPDEFRQPPPEPGPLVRETPTLEPREEQAEDALPIELEVRHVDTWSDEGEPGAYLLRFEVEGLGPGGTSTDLGIVAKVGWQVEVLTSSQDIGEGETATYDVRIVAPAEGRTSSTITVGAWGEAARAEPVVVNVRSLTTSGTAAGHPVPVWGYASGGAVLAAAAAAFVWFSEPRRYGFLRYLLAMFPAIGGFSRIQGEKVLEHEAREKIHQVIENQPGIHYRALLRELRMSNGRLAHHLQTLEREGIVRTESVAGKLHFYVTGSSAVRGTPLTDRQRALLAMIKKEPGILQSRLADRLGVSRQALHQHLDSLREQNLLIDARFGRTKALYLEADADQRLTVCHACQAFYDRGQGITAGVVCPGCGQGA